MDSSTDIIKKIGNRLQIIDASMCPNISADIAIEYVERLKNETGCKRAIIIVDYLQVWPTNGLRFSSDLEADKWRIGELKKVRAALYIVHQDPVIVISEARKPSGKDDVWGDDLSDVMGSARGSYTPDAVWFLSELPLLTLNKLFKDEKITIPNEEGDTEDKKSKSPHIRDFLANIGIAVCKLKMPKCRDGMTRFNMPLLFHFRKNKFELINWLELRMTIEKQKRKEEDEKNKTSAKRNIAY